MTYTNSTVLFESLPTDPRFIDLTGEIFGHLTIVCYAFRQRGKHKWLARCQCGESKIVFGCNLARRRDVSCGCVQRQKTIARNISHGEAIRQHVSVEYRTYQGAKRRCQEVTNHKYPIYGGRGVEFKFKDFGEFLDAVGRRPSPHHSLNRIDNDGHYEAGNVQWATRTEQTRNRSITVSLTFEGETKPLAEWSEIYTHISLSALRRRVTRKWCHACLFALGPNQGCPHR